MMILVEKITGMDSSCRKQDNHLHRSTDPSSFKQSSHGAKQSLHLHTALTAWSSYLATDETKLLIRSENISLVSNSQDK